MTDEEIIKRAKEAEKRTGFGELVHSPISKGVNSAYGIGYIEGMVEYRKSLQEEPVSEDLEEACEQLAENARKHKAETISPFFSPTDYKQGVIDGANWKEQQMMKDAVNGWVFRDMKDGKLRISDNKECWNGIRIPEKSIEKSYLICTTDDAIKVKLVIVKED